MLSGVVMVYHCSSFWLQNEQVFSLIFSVDHFVMSDLHIHSVSEGFLSEADCNFWRTTNFSIPPPPPPPQKENFCRNTFAYIFQKVDIYSLGIIFFEMVYKRLPTLMERIQVLTNLRKPHIIFPKDFDEHGELENQAALLRQMLNHDPSQRPSSRDVLASPNLPAVQEAEAEFNRRVEEAISNPEGQVYRRILTHLFSQKYSRAMDETYNMDQTKSKNVRLGGCSGGSGVISDNTDRTQRNTLNRMTRYDIPDWLTQYDIPDWMTQ